MLSNGCNQINLFALLLVLNHNLRNCLERRLLRQLLLVLLLCNGFIRLYQPISAAHYILDKCLLFCICIRIATTFILIFWNLLSLSSIGNHSFSTNLNSFAHCCSFVYFAFLKQLTFCRHGLKYPWCNLLFTHVSRPIIIVDFNLLDTYATAGQYLRNLDLLMVICIGRTILPIKYFLKIRILTHSYR